jgi:hypothetical protein
MSKKPYSAADNQFILNNAGKMKWADLGKQIGHSGNQVRNQYYKISTKGGKVNEDSAFEKSGRSFTSEINGENEQVVTSVDDRIRTVEDLVKARKIDLKVWRVKNATVSQHEGFFRDRSFPVTQDKGKKDHWHRTAKVVQLYSVKVWLERRRESDKHNAWLRDQLLADMDKLSPAPVRIIRPPMKREFMYELGPADHHFGKLCWAKETGENFDLKIATADFDRSFDDLLSRVRDYPLERILLVIGNDLLHVDNANNTTTAGTQQDTDGRWQKSFLEAKRALVSNIEKCREFAPVHIAVVPGNHDFQRMFYVGDTIQSWFRNYADVTVDNSPMSRKYVEYGVNLLGLSHGCDEKDADFKDLMANEAAEAWARTRHHEWHLGHLHTRKEKIYNKGNTHGGVVVRRLPSLTRTDAWHYRKGYVGSEHASEAYLWHKALGYYGHFSHSSESTFKRVTSVTSLAVAA